MESELIADIIVKAFYVFAIIGLCAVIVLPIFFYKGR